MQSSILKYFKLREDKKLLWFSVRIWTRDPVMDDGWKFLWFSPPSVQKFSVYSQISIIFCQWRGGWCMISLRIISNHFLACYRLWIRKPDKLSGCFADIQYHHRNLERIRRRYETKHNLTHQQPSISSIKIQILEDGMSEQANWAIHY